MSINIILYQAVFQQIYLKFCFDSFTFIFLLFSSDTIQALMSVCPSISVLHFNECCHPCYNENLQNMLCFYLSIYLATCLTIYYLYIYILVQRNLCFCMELNIILFLKGQLHEMPLNLNLVNCIIFPVQWFKGVVS